MRASPWLLAVTVLLLAAGCGTGSRPATGPALQTARDRVPSDLRQAGVMVVGSDETYAPMEFVKDGKAAGFDVDLAGAIAGKLGLRLDFRATDFGTLIDQATAGKLTMAMSSMTDNAKRQQQVEFVDYLNVGSSIVVHKDAADVAGYRGLCGLRVGGQPDTFYVDVLNETAGACPTGHKLTPVVTKDPVAAMRSGQIDAYVNDYPLAAYDVSNDSSLRISGEQIEAAPYGIAVAKQRHDIAKAVQAALYELIDDGTYDKIVKTWKLPNGSLKTGALNGGA
jgi:polar amino acid transport system substrate-binding protein